MQIKAQGKSLFTGAVLSQHTYASNS